MLRFCDRSTPLNWTMTAWSSRGTSTTKQNRIYQFFQKRFNQRWLQFLFAYSFSNWPAVSCFSFWKAFIKLSVFDCKRHFWWRQTWRHLHVTMLKCWAIFSNILIHWRIRMIPAKNYETVFKFVKVMPRKLVASFFWTRCMQMFAGVPSASGRRHQVPYNKWCLSTWKHTSLCAAIVTAICYGQNQYPINALNPMSLNSFRIESAQSIVAVSVNKIKVK